jgi:tetratricopeptide (TPR) repeat protein
MFLTGRVATEDGTRLPSDVLVERLCNARVRQQVYASPGGDFSMQLGPLTDSFVDATGDGSASNGASPSGRSPYGTPPRDPEMGIPRRDLVGCELRASAHGFRPNTVSLLDLSSFGNMMESVDVGAIVVHRISKTKGTMLSANPYNAPKDARAAYEQGLKAKKNGQVAAAQESFEKAVTLYPKYAIAWFQLGVVLQQQKQQPAARRAYMEAAMADKTLLPPYLSLTIMAYEEKNWTEVVRLSDHIIALDPTNHAALTEYILNLDALDFTGAYFYNAVANYHLNRIDEAEKNGLKVEHLDLRTPFPEVHLLLGNIFARKKNYAAAIMEMRTYLDLVPHATDVEQVREQLANFEKLNSSQSTIPTSDPH